MSKLNQIENAILELNGAEFQKLADAYLHARGIGRVHPIGSVIGKNKEKKGTPDSLFVNASDQYVFAEYTTQQTDLAEKLEVDLRKCLSKKKTGVPVAEIDRVIFCYSGELAADSIRKLFKIAEKAGVKLELIGNAALAHDLSSKYPGLAREYLRVSLDTGQVVSLEEFVEHYDANRLATPLRLTFHARERELEQLTDYVETERLVLLVGRPGVGKSRLALEACRLFRERHSTYQTFCIHGRNRDLWDDLQVWFRKPGNYLIFVDDANRISRFDYITDLLLHTREDQTIKVVATVRDYALSLVQEMAASLGEPKIMELQRMSDDALKEILQEEYSIHNPRYLDRIIEVANGNPRLAIMAAEVAREKEFDGIRDVSALYDRYFQAIRQEILTKGTDLQSAPLLKAAATIHFFRAIDRTNEPLMAMVERTASLSSDEFWSCAEQLHDMELADVYENEVVRITDQVLGTYLFYLAYFRENVLEFHSLLESSLPRYRNRLLDAVNPVLNAFGFERIAALIGQHVSRLRQRLHAERDKLLLFHLHDLFWFTDRTNTLAAIRQEIDRCDIESVDVSDLDIRKGSEAIASPSILSVLRQYASADIAEARIAIQLLARYLDRCPSQIQGVVKVLVDDYGIRPHSVDQDYALQSLVVETVWSYHPSGSTLFSRLFILLAREYLHGEFEVHRMINDATVSITRFKLVSSPQLTLFRQGILEKLPVIFAQVGLESEVLDLLNSYCAFDYRSPSASVVKDDMSVLLPFLLNSLDRSEYEHCVVFHAYLGLLRRSGIEVTDELERDFRCETYSLSEVLLYDGDDQEDALLSYEEVGKRQLAMLAKYAEGFKEKDYAILFRRCVEICSAKVNTTKDWLVQGAISNLLAWLADQDPNLYIYVVALYLERPEPARLNTHRLVSKLVEHHGVPTTRSLLEAKVSSAGHRWLFGLYEVLPPEAIDCESLSALLELYRVSQPGDMPSDIDYVLQYRVCDGEIVAQVVASVLQRANSNLWVLHSISSLFNPYSKTSKLLLEIFAGAHDVLKEAYLRLENSRFAMDHSGALLNQLLDLDNAFVDAFIRVRQQGNVDDTRYGESDHARFSVVWSRLDCWSIMDRVLDCIYDAKAGRAMFPGPQVEDFFGGSADEASVSTDIQTKHDAYLAHALAKAGSDHNYRRFLFRAISQFGPERRRSHIRQFLTLDTKIESFEELPLEPASWSASGSWVPVLQERVAFYESLLPMLDSVELLLHRLHVQSVIDALQQRIGREKKDDFAGE